MSKKVLKFQRLKELDTIWHPETKLVLKSATEKIVIGRYVDSTFIPLDETALELCELHKFKYDESLLTNAVEEEEGGEEEGEEQEEGGEEEEQEQEEGGEEEEDAGEEEGEEEVGGEEEGEEEEQPVVESVPEPTPVPQQKKESVAKKSADDSDFSAKFVFMNKYLSEVSSSVDNRIKNYEDEIAKLKESISKKNKEYESLDEKYTKLNTKFEGIKNLFS
jgi:hypothetical protein